MRGEPLEVPLVEDNGAHAEHSLRAALRQPCRFAELRDARSRRLGA